MKKFKLLILKRIVKSFLTFSKSVQEESYFHELLSFSSLICSFIDNRQRISKADISYLYDKWCRISFDRVHSDVINELFVLLRYYN